MESALALLPVPDVTYKKSRLSFHPKSKMLPLESILPGSEKVATGRVHFHDMQG